MTDMHGQNGRRLLSQPLATRFHEAQPCTRFFICFHATRDTRGAFQLAFS
ncbi:hypothetical protein NJ17_004562 [Salmonella enterica subsp. enterica]|nr:hypothetical protein [Salmonella enterica subsp. enterica]